MKTESQNSYARRPQSLGKATYLHVDEDLVAPAGHGDHLVADGPAAAAHVHGAGGRDARDLRRLPVHAGVGQSRGTADFLPVQFHLARRLADYQQRGNKSHEHNVEREPKIWCCSERREEMP